MSVSFVVNLSSARHSSLTPSNSSSWNSLSSLQYLYGSLVAYSWFSLWTLFGLSRPVAKYGVGSAEREEGVGVEEECVLLIRLDRGGPAASQEGEGERACVRTIAYLPVRILVVGSLAVCCLEAYEKNPGSRGPSERKR
jgi:hypothetical protein